MQEQTIIKQDKEYREYVKAVVENFRTNGKKTVVYFCDCYYPVVDGVIKVLENHAKNICNTYNVVIIAPKHKHRIIRDHNDFLLVGVSSMYFRFVNYDLAFPKLDQRLKPLLDSLKIDVIHSHSPFTLGAYAAKYAKKHGIPFVMTMHSQYKLDFMRYVKSEKVAMMLTKNLVKVFNQSTETWTMHEKAAETLRNYGYTGDIYFMPNATDYERPQNLDELRKIGRESFNVPPDTKVLLFVGRLVKQKNIFMIADSLKGLKERGVKFKAIFVGDGPDEGALRAKIEENGVLPDTIFTGRIDSREELSKIYATSDLFLFPSVYDTSSIVQIEAAGHNVPGVFIKDTVTANTITDNVTGFLCENNLEDFTNTVATALSDDQNLKAIGKQAGEKLYVTWVTLSKRIIDRYEYLIKENQK